MPYGHRKTTTFTAGLRVDGIVAPWVLDGPMDGKAFKTYIEKLLVPNSGPSCATATCSRSRTCSGPPRRSCAPARSIIHQSDAAIRGHVFCSFLALVLTKERADHCAAHDFRPEWDDVRRDLAEQLGHQPPQLLSREILDRNVSRRCHALFASQPGRAGNSQIHAPPGILPRLRLPLGTSANASI